MDSCWHFFHSIFWSFSLSPLLAIPSDMPVHLHFPTFQFLCPRLHSTLSGHSFIFFLQQQQDRPQKYGTLKNLFHFIITKSEINISEKEMDLWLQIFTENNISFFIFWWMDIVLNVFVISPSSSFSFSFLSSLSHHHHHHSLHRSFYCGIEWGCLGVDFLYFHLNAWDWML